MLLALSDLPLLFGAAFPESLNLLHLDQASAHVARTFTWPDNVVPIFQPSHRPELNPMERVWQALKKLFKDHNFPSLPALRRRVFKVVNSLTKTALRSLTGWSYLFSATQHI
jgi:transposase